MKTRVEYGGIVNVLKDNIEQSSPTTRRCPYGVSNEDIKKVEEFLELNKELHFICKDQRSSP
jgi:hypothetical protein